MTFGRSKESNLKEDVSKELTKFSYLPATATGIYAVNEQFNSPLGDFILWPRSRRRENACLRAVKLKTFFIEESTNRLARLQKKKLPPFLGRVSHRAWQVGIHRPHRSKPSKALAFPLAVLSLASKPIWSAGCFVLGFLPGGARRGGRRPQVGGGCGGPVYGIGGWSGDRSGILGAEDWIGGPRGGGGGGKPVHSKGLQIITRSAIFLVFVVG